MFFPCGDGLSLFCYLSNCLKTVALYYFDQFFPNISLLCKSWIVDSKVDLLMRFHVVLELQFFISSSVWEIKSKLCCKNVLPLFPTTITHLAQQKNVDSFFNEKESKGM